MLLEDTKRAYYNYNALISLVRESFPPSDLVRQRRGAIIIVRAAVPLRREEPTE